MRNRLSPVRTFFTLASVLLVTLLLGVQNVAADDTLKRLDQFTSELRTFTADFEQTLYGEDDEVIQSTRGNVILKRPGKFIWRYTKPASQEIVADGTNIWLFDKELEQVTVSSLNERIGGTPLVLLMGTVSLEEQFSITLLGPSDGIDWIELIPKDNSTDFEALYLGLNKMGLAAMELRDNFGQATQITFTKFKPDVALDDAQFNFKAPAGVDVIGEAVN